MVNIFGLRSLRFQNPFDLAHMVDRTIVKICSAGKDVLNTSCFFLFVKKRINRTFHII